MIKVFVQAIIFEDDGVIPLLKRKNTGYMDNCWGLPGGKLEPNETITEALKRELQEEVSIKTENINKFKLCGVITRYTKEDTYIDFIFRVWLKENVTVRNNEPDKCHCIQLFEYESDIPKLDDNGEVIIPHIRKFIEADTERIDDTVIFQSYNGKALNIKRYMQLNLPH